MKLGPGVLVVQLYMHSTFCPSVHLSLNRNPMKYLVRYTLVLNYEETTLPFAVFTISIIV